MAITALGRTDWDCSGLHDRGAKHAVGLSLDCVLLHCPFALGRVPIEGASPGDG
jgi:hypothetical protein